MTNPTGDALLARIKELEEALTFIQTLVHTATKDTSFRSAIYHYQADFDSIRVECKKALNK